MPSPKTVCLAAQAARLTKTETDIVLHVRRLSLSGDGLCSMSQDAIAADIGTCRTYVCELIDRLVNAGALIEVGRRITANGGRGIRLLKLSLDGLRRMAMSEKPDTTLQPIKKTVRSMACVKNTYDHKRDQRILNWCREHGFDAELSETMAAHGYDAYRRHAWRIYLDHRERGLT